MADINRIWLQSGDGNQVDAKKMRELNEAEVKDDKSQKLLFDFFNTNKDAPAGAFKQILDSGEVSTVFQKLQEYAQKDGNNILSNQEAQDFINNERFKADGDGGMTTKSLAEYGVTTQDLMNFANKFTSEVSNLSFNEGAVSQGVQNETSDYNSMSLEDARQAFQSSLDVKSSGVEKTPDEIKDLLNQDKYYQKSFGDNKIAICNPDNLNEIFAVIDNNNKPPVIQVFKEAIVQNNGDNWSKASGRAYTLNGTAMYDFEDIDYVAHKGVHHSGRVITADNIIEQDGQGASRVYGINSSTDEMTGAEHKRKGDLQAEYFTRSDGSQIQIDHVRGTTTEIDANDNAIVYDTKTKATIATIHSDHYDDGSISMQTRKNADGSIQTIAFKDTRETSSADAAHQKSEVKHFAIDQVQADIKEAIQMLKDYKANEGVFKSIVDMGLDIRGDGTTSNIEKLTELEGKLEALSNITDESEFTAKFQDTFGHTDFGKIKALKQVTEKYAQVSMLDGISNECDKLTTNPSISPTDDQLNELCTKVENLLTVMTQDPDGAHSVIENIRNKHQGEGAGYAIMSDLNQLVSEIKSSVDGQKDALLNGLSKDDLAQQIKTIYSETFGESYADVAQDLTTTIDIGAEVLQGAVEIAAGGVVLKGVSALAQVPKVAKGLSAARSAYTKVQRSYVAFRNENSAMKMVDNKVTRDILKKQTADHVKSAASGDYDFTETTEYSLERSVLGNVSKNKHAVNIINSSIGGLKRGDSIAEASINAVGNDAFISTGGRTAFRTVKKFSPSILQMVGLNRDVSLATLFGVTEANAPEIESAVVKRLDNGTYQLSMGGQQIVGDANQLCEFLNNIGKGDVSES